MTYVYVCVYVYVHVCVYVCVRMCVRMCTYVWTYVCTYAYVCVCWVMIIIRQIIGKEHFNSYYEAVRNKTLRRMLNYFIGNNYMVDFVAPMLLI